ncbi:MAG: hypothetical protein ACODAD_16640 [Planctomycetota bacterium]
MNIKAELFSALDALDAERIPSVLRGGLSLVVHGCPRFTQDIDLVVEEKDIRRLEATVKRLGFDRPSGWSVSGRGTPREQRLYRIVTSTKTVQVGCYPGSFGSGAPGFIPGCTNLYQKQATFHKLLTIQGERTVMDH